MKADFHLHSSEDHCDIIPHSAYELIDRCAALQYRVIAITNHRYLTFDEAWRDYARERGILLIPGVEANLQGRHVLILNANQDADKLRTFADLDAYQRANDVVTVAPHPFYFSFICLRGKLYQHSNLFDAVEIHYFYTRFLNPNKRAEKFAREHGKPLVGDSDCHRLQQLGLTYSWVLADPNVSSVMEALRKGDVRVETQPLNTWEAISLLSYLRLGQMKRFFRRFSGSSQVHKDKTDIILDSSVGTESRPLSSHRQ